MAQPWFPASPGDKTGAQWFLGSGVVLWPSVTTHSQTATSPSITPVQLGNPAVHSHTATSPSVLVLSTTPDSTFHAHTATVPGYKEVQAADAQHGHTATSPTIQVVTATYKAFRFHPTKLKSGATDAVQFSEFQILVGGARQSGATAYGFGTSSPGSETPDKANDGDTATKFLSFTKTAGYLYLVFPSAVSATGYRLATANDSSDRDPVSWDIYGSNDTTGATPGTWTLLTSVQDFATTESRSTYLPDFYFTPPSPRPNSASHSHLASSPSIAYFLWPNSTSLVLKSTSPSLAVALFPDGAIHWQTVDSPSILAGVTPDSTLHSNLAESPNLAIEGHFQPASTLHAQVVTTPSVFPSLSLGPSDSYHAHSATSANPPPVLSNEYWVRVRYAHQGQEKPDQPDHSWDPFQWAPS